MIKVNNEFESVEKLCFIGNGGFANVFRGLWNGKIVAIKEFRSDVEDKCILSEVAIMQRLQHPNIVKFHKCIYNPKPCIAMELMVETLYSLLHNSKPLEWTRRIQIALDVTRGLKYLHEDNNILHRDLKSKNVLIDHRNQAKLADFGISKEFDKTFVTNNAPGSTYWMAPELLGVTAKFSTKSDIYSLGITFWELVTRKDPFENGIALVIPFLVVNGVREEIPRSCPKEFALIIESCWHQDRDQRPSVGEVYTDLLARNRDIRDVRKAIEAIESAADSPSNSLYTKIVVDSFPVVVDNSRDKHVALGTSSKVSTNMISLLQYHNLQDKCPRGDEDNQESLYLSVDLLDGIWFLMQRDRNRFWKTLCLETINQFRNDDFYLLLYQVLNQHKKDPRAVVCGSAIVRMLACDKNVNDIVKVKLCEKGYCELLTEILAADIDTLTIQPTNGSGEVLQYRNFYLHLCGAIWTLTWNNNANKNRFNEGTVANLLKIVKTYQTDAAVVEQACGAIASLFSSDSENHLNVSRESCKDLMKALNHHIGNDVTVNAVIRCIRNISAKNVQNKKDLRLTGVCEALVGILERYGGAVDVVKTGCEVMRNICVVEDKDIDDKYGGVPACNALVAVLQSHCSNEAVVGAVILAMINMCLSSDDCRRAFKEMEGVLQGILDVAISVTITEETIKRKATSLKFHIFGKKSWFYSFFQ